jgi:ubiquitin carboxyl-terminal hydrolase 31
VCSRLRVECNLKLVCAFLKQNNFGRPEEQIAAEALANHLRCNNSIIQDIFGAQFRSSLTCPGCGKQSATFDPFVCVSLPIPQAKQEVPVYVNIIYLSQQPRQVRV